MKHYAGLDVSLEWTSVCVIDEAGRVVCEGKVASEPEPVAQFLGSAGVAIERVGLEAGPLSQWLHEGLAAAQLPVICVETRQMKAMLSASVNKTDRKDAHGIAQMMRVGLYRPVHVKTVASQERRLLLTSRKFLVGRLRDLENEIRGTLRNFGMKVGRVSRGRFAARVQELVAGRAMLERVLDAMLRARAALRRELDAVHKMVLEVVRDDPICRRLMTAPGVGAVVALTYRATVDVPARFARSKAVGAHFGLTPRKYQSGQTDRNGRVSKCGDEMMRAALYEAAHVLLTRTQRWSCVKAWAMRVAQRRGVAKAKVALARRLAVVLHRMWSDSTEFRWGKVPAGAGAAQ